MLVVISILLISPVDSYNFEDLGFHRIYLIYFVLYPFNKQTLQAQFITILSLLVFSESDQIGAIQWPIFPKIEVMNFTIHILNNPRHVKGRTLTNYDPACKIRSGCCKNMLSID